MVIGAVGILLFCSDPEAESAVLAIGLGCKQLFLTHHVQSTGMDQLWAILFYHIRRRSRLQTQVSFRSKKEVEIACIWQVLQKSTRYMTTSTNGLSNRVSHRIRHTTLIWPSQSLRLARTVFPKPPTRILPKPTNSERFCFPTVPTSGNVHRVRE